MPSSPGGRGLCVLAVPALGACGPPPSTSPSISPGPAETASRSAAPVSSGPPIPVLGTENFYADLLRQIGGARVSASSPLNDPSAHPHPYEASPAAATPPARPNLVIV